jgi:hypothetical protein
MFGGSTLLVCLGVVISRFLVHAAMDPVDARFLVVFGSENIVVSSFLVHTSYDPEDTSRVSGGFAVKVSGDGVHAPIDPVEAFTIINLGFLVEVSGLCVHTSFVVVLAETLVHFLSLGVEGTSCLVHASNSPSNATTVSSSLRVVVLGTLVHASIDPEDTAEVNISVFLVVSSGFVHASSDGDEESLARAIIFGGFDVEITAACLGASEDMVETSIASSSFRVKVSGFLIHASVNPHDTTRVSGSLGVVVSGFFVHASINPHDTTRVSSSLGVVVSGFLVHASVNPHDTTRVSSSLGIVVSGFLVHASVNPHDTTRVSSSLRVVVSGFLVHASVNPLYARFLHAFGSEGIVVSGLLVHAARNPEDTADVLVSAFTPVSSLLVHASFDDGDSSETTRAHVELEEVSLSRSVISNTVELGSTSTDTSAGLPFLGFVLANASEKLSPFITKLEVETGRHGLFASLVSGFVHPDLVDIARDGFRVTFANVLSALAFSTADDHIGAVSVFDSHLAPDRAIGYLFLVARVNSLSLTPGLGFSGSDFASSFEEFSSHRSVKASTLLGNNDYGFHNDGLNNNRDDNGRSSSQRTGAHVELEEISLVLGVKSDSQKLSFTTDNVFDVPFLSDLSSGASEERSPARVSEF